MAENTVLASFLPTKRDLRRKSSSPPTTAKHLVRKLDKLFAVLGLGTPTFSSPIPQSIHGSVNTSTDTVIYRESKEVVEFPSSGRPLVSPQLVGSKVRLMYLFGVSSRSSSDEKHSEKHQSSSRTTMDEWDRQSSLDEVEVEDVVSITLGSGEGDSASGRRSLMDLPDELIVDILRFLPPQPSHILTASLVSRRLHSLAQSPQLWLRLIDLTPGIPISCEGRRRGHAVLHPPPGQWTKEGWMWRKRSLHSKRSAHTTRDEIGSWPFLEQDRSQRQEPEVVADAHAVHPDDHDDVPIHYPTLFRSRHFFPSTVRKLIRLHHPHTATLSAHSDSVYALHFINDLLITASRDRSIKMWRLPVLPNGDEAIGDLKLLKTLENAHMGSVLCVQFEYHAWDREGRGLMVTGSSDKTAAVWEISWDNEIGIEKLASLTGHEGGVLSVALGKNHIVTCGKDRTIRVYARATFECQHTIRSHRGPINSLSIHPDADVAQAVSASGDGSWIVHSLMTGEAIIKVDNASTPARLGMGLGTGLACVKWRGPYLVTGSNDRLIRLYDAVSGVLVRTYEGPSDLVRSVELVLEHNGGGLVLAASYDQSVWVYDLQTGTLIQRLSRHNSLIFDIQMDNGRLISASHDKTVHITTFGTDLPYRGLFA